MLHITVLFKFLYIFNHFSADNITINGTNNIPYTSLMDSFDDYSQDSWTYDGRYMFRYVVDVKYYNQIT